MVILYVAVMLWCVLWKRDFGKIGVKFSFLLQSRFDSLECAESDVCEQRNIEEQQHTPFFLNAVVHLCQHSINQTYTPLQPCITHENCPLYNHSCIHDVSQHNIWISSTSQEDIVDPQYYLLGGNTTGRPQNSIRSSICDRQETHYSIRWCLQFVQQCSKPRPWLGSSRKATFLCPSKQCWQIIIASKWKGSRWYQFNCCCYRRWSLYQVGCHFGHIRTIVTTPTIANEAACPTWSLPGTSVLEGHYLWRSGW